MPDETNGLPLQDASFDGLLLRPRGDSSATKAAGPQLTAPVLSKTGPRKDAIRLVEHTESDGPAPANTTQIEHTSIQPKQQAESSFDWGSLGGLNAKTESQNAGSAAAAEKPATRPSQLKWK
jgi:hypothetical protein